MAATKKKTTAKKTTKKAVSKKDTANKSDKKSHDKKDSKTDSSVKSSSAKVSESKAKDTHKTESKKHVSESTKDNNTWMIVAIVLGIIVIFLVASIGILYSSNKQASQEGINHENEIPQEDGSNTPQNTTLTGNVNLLVVEDSTCESCQVDTFATQLKDNLIEDLEYEKISYDSEEGIAIIDAVGATQVPIYLFSENIADRDDWADLEGAFVQVEANKVSYYMLNPAYVSNKVLIESPVITDTAIIIGEDDAPVTLFEFTDFECPYCAIAEGSENLVEQFSASYPDYVPAIPAVIENYVETGCVIVSLLESNPG